MNMDKIETLETQNTHKNIDENNPRKKAAKKRERSPTSLNDHAQKHSNNSASNNQTTSLNNSTQLTNNNQPNSTSCLSNTNQTTNTTQNQIIKKEKQKPESWNKIEQQIFFNALRQNGKNFESITQYFNARQKRYKLDDGTSVQRSKEQIRHFYYRTWHKIIKYISIPMLKENQTSAQADQTANTSNNTNNNDINGKIILNITNSSLRDMQVKCLIAFNALMNKSHRWNKKTAIKLVELINHGWTTVREKGKITRLRMPICKLSSKSLQSEVEASNNSLPDTLNVYLEPNSESAYCRVHRLAQNPFLNIEIQSLQTIKYLIEFLENKWKNRREQFMEKFQIHQQEHEINNTNLKKTNQQEHQQTSLTESDDNENSNTNSKNRTNLNIIYVEKLIIYPSETHQLTTIDLSEANSLITSNLNNNFQVKNEQNENKSSEKANSKLVEENDLNIIYDDPMGIDDCAVNPDNFLSTNKQNTVTKKETQNYNLNTDQIKSGLTSKNSFIIQNGKEKKELTFIQLYLALNKPSCIKLKYDWVMTNSNTNESSVSNLINNHSSNSTTSIQQTLTYKQNLQQRFYIDTLANVAAAFLNDIQQKSKPNETITNNNNQSTSMQTNTVNSSNNKLDSNKLSNSNQQQQQQPLQQQMTKSPIKQPQASSSATSTPSSSTQKSTSQQSIAFLQPIKSPNQATILSLETVLQKLSEEQTNKTKKLLSDLSSKRRSRQRKQIMVVNTSHSPRAMLPKINLINAQHLFSNEIASINNTNNNNNNQGSSSSSNENVTAQPQQNIVYSGPMAAIARQIVNNTSQVQNETNKQVQIQKQQQTQVQDDQNQTQSPKILLSSFQQSYSNIIPQILNNLVDNNNQTDTNNLDANKNSENLNLCSPQNLTDMSLLELSINNADSLFGSSVVRINNDQNDQLNVNKNSNVAKDDSTNLINLQTCKPQETTNFLISNESSTMSSLSNLLISLTGQKSTNCSESNQAIRTNSNVNPSTSVSLSHRRSDIMVEWTDSMNDVSLTGCYINDIQSPEKSVKNTNLILNENSRDSIFLNMDTIMNILPVGVNRYDDSSLLNSSNNTMNTMDNIVVKDLQSTSRI